jgi:hypothetical protein
MTLLEHKYRGFLSNLSNSYTSPAGTVYYYLEEDNKRVRRRGKYSKSIDYKVTKK